MSRLIIATIVLIGLAVVAMLMLPFPISQETVPTEEETTEETEVSTVDESYLLEDLYITILEEEMDALDIEQTEYNNEIEEQLASDLSQFYYS